MRIQEMNTYLFKYVLFDIKYFSKNSALIPDITLMNTFIVRYCYSVTYMNLFIHDVVCSVMFLLSIVLIELSLDWLWLCLALWCNANDCCLYFVHKNLVNLAFHGCISCFRWVFIKVNINSWSPSPVMPIEISYGIGLHYQRLYRDLDFAHV